jgi:C-terminus of AA_permease
MPTLPTAAAAAAVTATYTPLTEPARHTSVMKHFRVPLVPYIPAAALWVNYFLLSQLSWLGFLSLLGYVSIGLTYCKYTAGSVFICNTTLCLMLLQAAPTSTSTTTAASAQLFVASVHYDSVSQPWHCATFSCKQICKLPTVADLLWGMRHSVGSGSGWAQLLQQQAHSHSDSSSNSSSSNDSSSSKSRQHASGTVADSSAADDDMRSSLLLNHSSITDDDHSEQQHCASSSSTANGTARAGVTVSSAVRSEPLYSLNKMLIV